MLDQLKKNGLFVNLKKCCVSKDEIRFLGYVILAKVVEINDERMNAVKNWPEQKSIRDIQVVSRFANFY